MKRVNGILYYSLKEIAIWVNRDYQTVLRWYKFSEEQRKQGKVGLLPIPTMIGRGHYYSEAEVRQIRERVKRFKRGTFGEFEKRKTAYQRLKEENQSLKDRIKELEMGVR